METNFKAEIGTNEILAQNEQETTIAAQKGVAFNEKNYLQTSIQKGEKEKNITIRLLPFSPEGGTPFKKIYMHSVNVNKEISSSGWKKFVCPSHNGYDKPCPFCEITENAWKEYKTELDPVKKEYYKKIAINNSAKEYWVVRCIERGHEDDGPKFWLFANSKKHNGIYDNIINIFKRRAAKNEGYNIFSLQNGKDLEINIKLTDDGKRAINIVDSDEKTPLSEDIEKANSWIEDTKKWDDVFKIKPYDFMKIVLEMKVPIYDKEKKCYVEKLSAEEFKEQKEKEANDIAAKTPEEFTQKEPTEETEEDNSEEDLPF